MSMDNKKILSTHYGIVAKIIIQNKHYKKKILGGTNCLKVRVL